MLYNPLGVYYLARRETMRFVKVYLQTIFAPLLTNLLFLGIFGASLANRDVGIEGVKYLPFLIPGLCAMGAMMNAFQNPSSSLQFLSHQLTQDPELARREILLVALRIHKQHVDGVVILVPRIDQP